jgi:AraC-like DNA-binding protein
MSVKYRPADEDDVLADVLRSLRLRSRLFCRSELSAPWAMTLQAGDYAHFHVVERGGAWLRLEGETVATPLASGDLVVIPHGRGHTLSASPTALPVPLEELARERAAGHFVVRDGGGGAETEMICGSFEFDLTRDNPVLAVLPPVLHVRRGGGSAEWVGPILGLLSAEARSAREGSATIVARLTDVIFVQAVRAWLDEQPPGSGGWLGALRDPHVGRALALMHREPARDWSVSSLAGEVGMSRSPFARRFRDRVGEPPLAYLTRWRMRLAADLIRGERLRLETVAGRVGYDSEPAFSRAFKRRFGLSPSAYRASAARPDASKSSPAS